MKFETRRFHMFTNNNWDIILWIRSPLPLGRLSSSLKKVKFFIYGVILLKFETEHFHMFTNENLDYNS